MSYGYHYTSLHNWQNIKNEGLIPYLLSVNHKFAQWREQEFKPVHPLYGIWVWAGQGDDNSHIGNICMQATMKDTSDIVHLRIHFPVWPDPDLLLEPKSKALWIIKHTGTINQFQYHDDAVGFIITKPIPTSRIDFLANYNTEMMAAA